MLRKDKRQSTFAEAMVDEESIKTKVKRNKEKGKRKKAKGIIKKSPRGAKYL